MNQDHLGPLDRGHDPATILGDVLHEETPNGWRAMSTAYVFGARKIAFTIQRPDGTILDGAISYDTINRGDTRLAVRKAIEALRRA